MLVNAIWFKANWRVTFDPELTRPGDFTLLDGATVSADLMYANQKFSFASTDDYTAVRLPYAGDAAMVIALPKAGATPADLAKTMTAGDLRPEWTTYLVDLTMPKFEFDSDVPLKGVLISLGMVDAFSLNFADFSGIADLQATGEQLYVEDVLHKSYIALDENGTEAPAATAVIVSATSLPPSTTFTADRPFLFWIEHASTAEILFLGQVTNPATG